jgi:hypothetical protein
MPLRQFPWQRYLGAGFLVLSYRGNMLLALDIATAPLCLGLHDFGGNYNPRLVAAHENGIEFS